MMHQVARLLVQSLQMKVGMFQDGEKQRPESGAAQQRRSNRRSKKIVGLP